MQHLHKLLIIGLIFMFTGCASIEVIYPTTTEVKHPTPFVVHQVSLGEKMLESGKATRTKGFNVKSTTQIFSGWVASGDYHLFGKSGDDMYFKPANNVGTGVYDLFKTPALHADVYVEGGTGRLCFDAGLGARPCSDEIRPVINDVYIYREDSLVQELIYTGRVGNKIRFKYRELRFSTTHQGLDVDIEYDLSESGIISYKNAQLEILEASNQSIRYKVLSHFKNTRDFTY